MIRRFVAIALLLTSLGVTVPSHATDGMVVTTVGFKFVPGDRELPTTTLIIKQGSQLLYVNADVAPHSIVSDAFKPTGGRKFATLIVDTGGSADVAGVSALAAGTYTFFCGVHPTIMFGTLTVQ